MSIHSITFTDKYKKGFLFEHGKGYVLKKGKTKEDYQNALKEPRKYQKYGRDIASHFYDEEDTGLVAELANECLINHKFEFSTDKINILFGPNASGKTTIIKAIAKAACCGNDENIMDGMTNIIKYKPSDFYKIFSDYHPLDFDTVFKIITRGKFESPQNHFSLDWDGNVVYYHNYSGRRSTGTCEDFEIESIFGGFMENVMFFMEEKNMNAAKRSLIILSGLFNVAEKNPDIQSQIDTLYSMIDDSATESHKKKQNEVAKNLTKYIDTYREMHPNNPHQNTILLDEVDVNLDIPTLIGLYQYGLPNLQNINNQQIIVVSHSPLIMSPNVCDPNKYNIISLMPKYTDKVKQMLKTLTF